MGLNSDVRTARVGPSGESKHQAGLVTPEEGVPLMGGRVPVELRLRNEGVAACYIGTVEGTQGHWCWEG